MEDKYINMEAKLKELDNTLEKITDLTKDIPECNLGLKEINELNAVRKAIIEDKYDSECMKTLISLCPELLSYSNNEVMLLTKISEIIISELQSFIVEGEKQKLFFNNKIDEILKENADYIKNYKPKNIYTHDISMGISHFHDASAIEQHRCEIKTGIYPHKHNPIYEWGVK